MRSDQQSLVDPGRSEVQPYLLWPEREGGFPLRGDAFAWPFLTGLAVSSSASVLIRAIVPLVSSNAGPVFCFLSWPRQPPDETRTPALTRFGGTRNESYRTSTRCA